MKPFKIWFVNKDDEAHLPKKKLGHEIIKARNKKAALKLFAEENGDKIPLLAEAG